MLDKNAEKFGKARSRIIVFRGGRAPGEEEEEEDILDLP